MARPRSEMGDIRSSPRNRRLVQFFKRKPVPARLVGETEDGDEVTCAVNAPSPAQWQDALGVLRDCVRVRALDSKDQTLRVITLDPFDPELRAEAETADALRGVASSAPGSVPIISVDLPKLVDNIARNMREVAGEASRQNALAHKEGFTAMVSVVNIALNLLVGVEQRLARAEDALQATAGAGDDPEGQRGQLAMMALQKALGGGNGAGGAGLGELMKLAAAMQAQQQGGGES